MATMTILISVLISAPTVKVGMMTRAERAGKLGEVVVVGMMMMTLRKSAIGPNPLAQGMVAQSCSRWRKDCCIMGMYPHIDKMKCLYPIFMLDVMNS